tara:strand:+ start:8762 stop:9646 length:885 start_codon:yes stop_codon:yes gene_type:complete
MNFFITGSTGYIGSKLVSNLLRQGYVVFPHSRESKKLKKFINVDNCTPVSFDTDSFEEIQTFFSNNKVDYIIHLAAKTGFDISGKDVSDLIDANIKFPTLLLEATKVLKNPPSFINTSTFWQYYDKEYYNPFCLYASTKQSFEDILDHYCKNEGFKAISLRLYDVYGKDDGRNKLLSRLNLLQEGQEFYLTQGNQKLSFVYIDDVIKAFESAINLVKKNNQGSHKKYSVCGQVKTLREFVDLYIKILNKKININWGEVSYRRNQPMNIFLGDILPDWEAKTSPKIGIKKIVECT